jgi:hypothetical protein
VYFRQCQGDLAVGGVRRGPHHRGAARIVSLESRPAQRALGVLVVEQVDQAGGFVRIAEVFVQAAGQFCDQARVRPAGSRGDRVTLEQQVVGQHDPVA